MLLLTGIITIPVVTMLVAKIYVYNQSLVPIRTFRPTTWLSDRRNINACDSPLMRRILAGGCSKISSRDGWPPYFLERSTDSKRILTRPVKNYIWRANTDSNFALFFKEFKKTFTKANTDSTDRAPIQKFTENKIV